MSARFLRRNGRFAWRGGAAFVLLLPALLLFPLAPGSASADPTSDPSLILLDPPAYLNRISMDLRGTRATPAELQSWAGEGYSESALDELITQFMASEAFYDRIEWLANDILLTRKSDMTFFSESFNFMNEDVRADAILALGNETPKLLEHIVRNDRPLTELVTADYTIANSTLAWFWNTEYDGPRGSDEWQVVRYQDGREHAGVLSQSSFYYRYPSTFTNKNRHRANQVSRILLNDDHFMRNIAIDLRMGSGDDEVDLDDAPRTNPSCYACHATLDGLSAHFYGFSMGPAGSQLYARQRFGYFAEEGAERGLVRLGRTKSYYGYPSTGIRDLGQYIANDPRFAQAMVTHIFRFYTQRKMDYRDRDLVNHLAAILVDNGYDTKALIRAVVKLDVYRAVGLEASTTKQKPDGIKPSAGGDSTAILQQWDKARMDLQKSNIPGPTRDELQRILHFHEEMAAETVALEADQTPGGMKSLAKFPSYPLDQAVQPFKLATPEQLHSMGLALTDQVWDGKEGGSDLLPHMTSLEYNTDFKVAAGGYDGELILERADAIPASYLLVIERWATVLANDVVDREIVALAPPEERRVFTLLSGTEIPSASEAAIRAQVAEWIERFYGLEGKPDHPLADAAYGILQAAHNEATTLYGEEDSLAIAWKHTLAMLLSDIRIATY